MLFDIYYRLETTTTVYPADVVLFEGILTFYQKEIRDIFHMKLFVDSDADTRLARRGKFVYFLFVYWAFETKTLK